MFFAKKTTLVSFVGPVLKFFGSFYCIPRLILLYVAFEIITAATGVVKTRGASTRDASARFWGKGIVFLSKVT